MSQTIAVIGAGTMGNGIAHVFAQAGHNVVLVEAAPAALDRGMSAIKGNMSRQVKKATLTEQAMNESIARITPTVELSGVAPADLVIEAIIENGDAKKGLYAKLDAVCRPEAIFASNTSSISITELAAATKRADKFIGMHFFNPVPVMKLVEVIRGIATSDATCAAIMELSTAVGKSPVEVNDSPGFVSNRVLMPMINEAIYCVMEGVAKPEAIDEVMKLGMAHPMGPLTLADFIGLDICLNILKVLHDGFGDPKYYPCPLLVKMVAAGRLGRKSGRGFFTYEGK